MEGNADGSASVLRRLAALPPLLSEPALVGDTTADSPEAEFSATLAVAFEYDANDEYKKKI
jgi:hypothetical protein